MFCTKCGEENADDSKFCRKCGTPLEPLNNEFSEEEYGKIDNTSEIKRTPRQERTYKTKNSNSNNTIIISIIAIGICLLFACILFMGNFNDGDNNLYGDSDGDLESAYNKVLNQDSSYSNYMELASDNSYIEIDTNPNDMDDYYSDTAHELIKVMNKELGFSASLENKMSHTRSVDGIQSEKVNNIEVTWSYHPDHGLEVQYAKSK